MNRPVRSGARDEVLRSQVWNGPGGGSFYTATLFGIASAAFASRRDTVITCQCRGQIIPIGLKQFFIHFP